MESTITAVEFYGIIAIVSVIVLIGCHIVDKVAHPNRPKF